MTITPIDLDNVDMRPAQHVLGLIRTYRITRDEQHLDTIADYLNRITTDDTGPASDAAILVAVETVLGTGLNYPEMTRALRLPTSDTKRPTREPAVTRVRADMRHLMAQAA